MYFLYNAICIFIKHLCITVLALGPDLCNSITLLYII